MNSRRSESLEPRLSRDKIKGHCTVSDLPVSQFFIRKNSAENGLSALLFLSSVAIKSGTVFLLAFCCAFPQDRQLFCPMYFTRLVGFGAARDLAVRDSLKLHWISKIHPGLSCGNK